MITLSSCWVFRQISSTHSVTSLIVFKTSRQRSLFLKASYTNLAVDWMRTEFVMILINFSLSLRTLSLRISIGRHFSRNSLDMGQWSRKCFSSSTNVDPRALQYVQYLSSACVLLYPSGHGQRIYLNNIHIKAYEMLLITLFI